MDEPTSRSVPVVNLLRSVLKRKRLTGSCDFDSVDREEEAKMQNIIRSEFANHTVIMITHRLAALLDFDQVLVLEHGKVVESGRPAVLLEDDASHFSRLYRASEDKTR